MLKHSRKFKLVPVEERETEEGEGTPTVLPTPPVLTKLNMLDRELRDIMEDSTLSEKEKMERYENTLMKWGKFYHQYQSAENSVRENSINSSSSSSINNNSRWHSTPNTITFTPTRHRSRSPVRREVFTTPTGPLERAPSPRHTSREILYATPPSSVHKKKKRNKKQDRKLTPPQAIRASRRLLERLPKQIGSSWLPWRPRKRH